MSRKSQGGITVAGQAAIIKAFSSMAANIVGMTMNDIQVHVNNAVRLADVQIAKNRTAAKSVNAASFSDSRVLIKEHVFPVIMRVEFLLKNAATMAVEDIASYLDDTSIIVMVTPEEDAKLSAAGLGSKMPVEYYDSTSLMYNNMAARYMKVGIEVV